MEDNGKNKITIIFKKVVKNPLFAIPWICLIFLPHCFYVTGSQTPSSLFCIPFNEHGITRYITKSQGEILHWQTFFLVLFGCGVFIFMSSEILRGKVKTVSPISKPIRVLLFSFFVFLFLFFIYTFFIVGTP